MSAGVRLVAALAAGVVALTAVASIAHADADPASDYLIQSDAFYPFSTKVSGGQKRALEAALASGRKAGVPVKVAIVAAPSDLGSVTVLFKLPPQRYAKFLGTEIGFVSKARVLVVMPSGYGLWRSGRPVPARELAAVRALPPPGSDDGDRLAAAANTAVRRLLALHDVRVAAPPPVQSSTTADRIKIAVGAIVIAAIGLAVSTLLRRRRRASTG